MPAPTVTRLLANGRLDPSFGIDGTAKIELGPGFATTVGIAVSGDKIVILGGPETERNGTVGGPSLVRLDSKTRRSSSRAARSNAVSATTASR